MELIESYGLTLADINNLVRHAISAADNVHPHNLLNQFDGPPSQSQSPLPSKQRSSKDEQLKSDKNDMPNLMFN